MNCKKAMDVLCEYLDGTLSPAEHEDVQKHVTNCICCPKIVESYTKTTSLCQKALRKSAPREFVENLLLKLRDKTSPR